VDGRRLWCCLGGGTGELALDNRSVGDLLTSLFLVGGRELGCEVVQERVRDEVDDTVDDGDDNERELVGDEEKDSDKRRSHLREVEGRDSGGGMQVEVGVN